ncbi:TIR domain-containing protein [Ningiella sp. W23]|uniref:TIR domain-containing protein n=1 Tax=Ningiella sp. W23 TaxID=3023715 RepID=UPI0037569BF2
MSAGLIKPFPAYKESDSFVFVCYAHTDADSVYQDLKLLYDAGINIWYDEGIEAGKSWRAEIATAIQAANKLIFFISKTSLVSKHCLREVDYALNHDIEIIPVYLDDSALPEELALVFNRVQALFKASDAMYSEHLIQALKSNKVFGAKAPIKAKSRLFMPLMALGFVLLTLLAWNQWDILTNSQNTSQGTPITANAYDDYLEGLALMERWDKEDNLDRAIDLFQEAYTADSSFALAYARSAEALRIRHILSGDESALEQASDAANQAAALNPNLAAVQASLALIHTTKGNIDLATAAVERALAIDSNDAMANKAAANVFAKLGRAEDAEASFQKAIALDSENPTVLNSYANFLLDQGRVDDAMTQWQALLRLAPDHYAALLNLGILFEEALRISEAISMYKKAIDIRPSYLAYVNLGTAYSKEARFEDAASAYLQALEIDTTDSLVWGNLAFLYSWMENMEEKSKDTFQYAIELAEAMRQQHPRDAFIYSDLALYYAKTNQPTLAQQRLNTAVTLAPNSAEILSAAAEASEILGQREKAVEFILLAQKQGYPTDSLKTSPELSNLARDPRLKGNAKNVHKQAQ